jgi:hypothetical protein
VVNFARAGSNLRQRAEHLQEHLLRQVLDVAAPAGPRKRKIVAITGPLQGLDDRAAGGLSPCWAARHGRR